MPQREVLVEPSKVLSSKFGDYFQSVWNKFDVLVIVLACASVALKNFRSTFEAARVLFAVNCALLFTRIFRIYHASQALGPKLVIFHRMIPEIVTFMFLLVVFIAAYGVASQAIIDPYRQFSWDGFWHLMFDIFFLPYWQMYGELSLETIEVKNTPKCESSTSSEFAPFAGASAPVPPEDEYCYPPDLETISNYKYVTPVFLAVYLLIGNVMLLNLLIAIFTSVFEEVHENSTDVWKWEMYRLVDEYDNKPSLPPPLVILEDMWKLIKGVWKRTCRRKRENLDVYMQDTITTLRVFERDQMSTFIEKEKEKEEQSLENRIDLLEKKTDQLLELFEEAPNDQDAWGETIDAQDKVYETTTTEEEEDTSDEDEEDGGGRKRKYSRNRRRKSFAGKNDGSKSRGKRKGRSVKFQQFEGTNPKSARIQTARASRAQRRIEADIVNIQEQLERLEEQRRSDSQHLEKLIRQSMGGGGSRR